MAFLRFRTGGSGFNSAVRVLVRFLNSLNPPSAGALLGLFVNSCGGAREKQGEALMATLGTVLDFDASDAPFLIFGEAALGCVVGFDAINVAPFSKRGSWYGTLILHSRRAGSKQISTLKQMEVKQAFYQQKKDLKSMPRGIVRYGSFLLRAHLHIVWQAALSGERVCTSTRARCTTKHTVDQEGMFVYIHINVYICTQIYVYICTYT